MKRSDSDAPAERVKCLRWTLARLSALQVPWRKLLFDKDGNVIVKDHYTGGAEGGKTCNAEEGDGLAIK